MGETQATGGPLFGGTAWPLGYQVGFLEKPWASVVKAAERWFRSLGVARIKNELGLRPLLEHLLALSPLQMPPGRELVVGTVGGWTMHVDNSRGGGDSFSWVGHLSGVLNCRGVIARHVPQQQDPFPSTQLELFGPEGKLPLRYIRTISAGIYDEGRWRFEVSGEAQPFESVDRYSARRIRDRFDRALLLRYLGSLGIRADDPAFFGVATLFEVSNPGRRWSATLEAARQERLGWAKSREMP